MSAAVGLASLWLVRRPAAFQEIEPDVDVRLSADNRMVDLAREDIDLALRYITPTPRRPAPPVLRGGGLSGGPHRSLPIKAPAVLRPEDLSKLTLLAFDNGHKAPWFSVEPWLVGLGLATPGPRPCSSSTSTTSSSAPPRNGRGIAQGAARWWGN
ncbi:MAG: hypothetical protein IPG33_07625 [Betaproteobacteria bacterium]|nr:hypothetical protein [Betaproteobacteria bacterium]